MAAHEAQASSEAMSGREEAADFTVPGAIDRLSDLAGAASSLALLAMAAIICFDVGSRYLFNEPTYWAPDVATYLLVGMTFMALATAQRSGSHIRVELLVDILGPGTRERIELIASWLGLLFVVFAGWQMIVFNHQEYVHDSRDWGLLATPQWIPQLPVSIGYVVFIFAILADIYRLRPPVSALARWSVPALAVALAIVLYALGPSPARIEGTRLDWGSAAIVVAFALAMLAWSGIRIALPVLGTVLALAAVFWWARDLALMPVTILLIVTLVLFLLLGVRVAMALGFAGLLGLYFLLPQPQLSLLAERSWSSVNAFSLTAVPMFVLMGALLVRSGVSTEMFDALMRWFGRVPGGIAYASVGASTIFAAVSGSSLATAATLGTVACPEMTRRGYSIRLSYGVVAAGATLGILIPPSIAMIIYGTTVGAPVTVLFVAGIVPGLLLMLCFMTGVFVWSKLVPGAAPRGASYSWRDKIASLLATLPFIALIIAVLGSLYAGIATPTEAGALGAAVALLLCLLRRQLSVASLYGTALETVRVTAFLLLIVVGASILSWVFDFLRLPRTMVEVVEAAQLAPWIVMAAIGLIYVILGMFIDPISMMLMTLPVTFPIVSALGFDDIWFGIALVLMIEVGLITPPIGMVLFVLRGIGGGDVPLKEIVMGVIPFVFIILAFLVLLYLFPEIVAWLPSRME